MYNYYYHGLYLLIHGSLLLSCKSLGLQVGNGDSGLRGLEFRIEGPGLRGWELGQFWVLGSGEATDF